MKRIGYILAIILGCFVFLFMIKTIYGVSNKNDNDSKEKRMVENLFKQSSTTIIEAPNYKGNRNKALTPVPKIRKIHQKQVEPTADIETWMKSNSIESENILLDAAPSFHHYKTLINNIPNLLAPLQLGNKYLHIWKKEDNYNFFVYGPHSYIEASPMRLLITDKDNTSVVRDYQFDNYVYIPCDDADKTLVNQFVRQFEMNDGILYFTHYHNTYSNFSYGLNGYISALDLKTNKILWTTKPLTCNSNFVVYGDYIITGYGFTNEPDYLYIIDKSNGAFVKKISLANAPGVIGMKENHIFVRTYSYEYEFVIQ